MKEPKQYEEAVLAAQQWMNIACDQDPTSKPDRCLQLALVEAVLAVAFAIRDADKSTWDLR